MIAPAYLDTLRRYVEEEIEGEAYFAELARRCPDPAAREYLRLLAEVERHAAAAALPLLDRHGLGPLDRAALGAAGRAAAAAETGDWAALAAGMRHSYPGFIAQFRDLEAMAPPGDRPRLAFLTAHETAALEFLERDLRGEPGATAPLLAYLATGPDGGAAA
jgi:hypothetical protein